MDEQAELFQGLILTSPIVKLLADTLSEISLYTLL